jgi:cytochrome c biogenesis protein CcmG/thiol:disulfide interchange protein DsbE
MGPRSKFLALIPLASFLMLAFVLALALRHSRHEASNFAQHVGDTAPVTALPVLGGGGAQFNTADWKGRPYVVNFFASWCVECRAENDVLMRFARAGITLIGFDYEDRPDALAKSLSHDGNPYLAIADDRAGRSGIDWGITGVPETFVVDASGVIRFHYAGPLTDDIVDDRILPLWEGLKK